MRSPRLPRSLSRPPCPRPLLNTRPPRPSRPARPSHPPRPVPRTHPLPLPIADTWRPGTICNSGDRFTISFMCVAVALKSLHIVGWHMMLDFKPIKCLLFNPSIKRSTLRFSNMPLYVPSAYLPTQHVSACKYSSKEVSLLLLVNLLRRLGRMSTCLTVLMAATVL